MGTETINRALPLEFSYNIFVNSTSFAGSLSTKYQTPLTTVFFIFTLYEDLFRWPWVYIVIYAYICM